MSYTALARKWRPKNFSELVGQEHVRRALTNALETGRVHHAFLFTGTRGVGKTTIARIFAKCLNCEKCVTPEPCGTCAACVEIDSGRFVDLIEVDAASRTKVDDTRELLDNVQYAPTRGRYKVYLIDEVHMLSTHSFNAILKTLEEPPPHVKFLLATTDPQKLPVTVLSRCLQFNLKRMPVGQIVEHMKALMEKEGVAYEPAGLRLVAQAADGSMRDGLSLLDQLIAFGGGKAGESEARSMLGTISRDHVERVVELLATMNGQELMKCARSLEEFSPDYAQVLDEIAGLLVRVGMKQTVPDFEGDDLYAPELLERLAKVLSPEDIQLYYQTAIIGRRDLALAPDPRTGFEMTLLRMIAFRPVNDSTMASPSGAGAAGAANRGAAVAAAGGGAHGSGAYGGGGAAGSNASGMGGGSQGAYSAGGGSAPSGASGGGGAAAARAAAKAAALGGGASRGGGATGSVQSAGSGGQGASAQAASGAAGPGQGGSGSQGSARSASVAGGSSAMSGELGAHGAVDGGPASGGAVNWSGNPNTGQSAAAAARAAASGANAGGSANSGAGSAATRTSQRGPTNDGAAAPSRRDLADGNTATDGGWASGATSATQRSSSSGTPDASQTWTDILSQLDIQGLPRQLASHCAFLGKQGGVVHLALDSKTKFVRTTSQEDKLAQALSRYYGEPIRLDITTAANDIDTPAQAELRASQQELDNARQSFEADPGVQGLRERFGATLLPDTVRPVK
jgi:DNA polymerase III subunit gamma/tau